MSITDTLRHDAKESQPSYWQQLANEANGRIERIFSESGISMSTALGHDGPINCYEDAKKALSFVLCHAETSGEKACAILSACEWLHASNELAKG